MTLGYVLSLCCNLNESAFSGISLPSQTAYSRVQAKMRAKTAMHFATLTVTILTERNLGTALDQDISHHH